MSATRLAARPFEAAILSAATNGGAGIAARRLAEALNARAEARASFLDISVLGESAPKDLAPQRNLNNHRVSDTHFTLEHPGFARGWLVEALRRYDLINVHWATYLVTLGELHALARAGRPMIFTLHDFNYLTGGCHYPAGCDRFARGCHDCPQVDRSRAAPETISRVLRVKREILAHPNVHLVAPSRWLRDQAVAAGAIPAARAHVVRNAYAPLAEPDLAREPGRVRVLVIADSLLERRKNMGLAIDALGVAVRLAAERGSDRSITVDLVGHADAALLARLKASGVAHVAHGRIAEHRALTPILAGADVLLTCSSEDNWPNVLVEAGAYGCVPVVGPGHGCAEFVRAFDFGEVAAAYDAESFATALLTAIERHGPERRAQALEAIRAAHAPDRIAETFLELARVIDGAGRGDARPDRRAALGAA